MENLIRPLNANLTVQDKAKLGACRPLAMSVLFDAREPATNNSEHRSLQQAQEALMRNEHPLIEARNDLLNFIKNGTVNNKSVLTLIQKDMHSLHQISPQIRQKNSEQFNVLYDDLLTYLPKINSHKRPQLERLVVDHVYNQANNLKSRLYLDALDALFEHHPKLLPKALLNQFHETILTYQNSLTELNLLIFKLIFELQTIAWNIHPIRNSGHKPSFAEIHQALLSSGPLLTSGTNGSAFYDAGAIVPKTLDIDGTMQTFLTLKTCERKSTEAIIASRVLHVVIIIGAIQFQSNHYILFHDPNHIAEVGKPLPTFMSRAENFIERIEPMNKGNHHTEQHLIYHCANTASMFAGSEPASVATSSLVQGAD